MGNVGDTSDGVKIARADEVPKAVFGEMLRRETALGVNIVVVQCDLSNGS